MSLTDFEKVCEFNKAFDFPQYDDFTNEKILKLRLDLIKEEITELRDAYDNLDTIEILDACADILYVAYGMAYTYKIDSDEILNKYKTKNTIFKSIDVNYYEEKYIIQYISNIEKLYNDLEKNTNNDIDTDKLWITHLHDIIIEVYKLQKIMNYDSDKIFTIVHNSNMSKLCKSEEEAKITVEKYQKDYLSGKSPYDSVYYYKLDNSELYVIKNKSTGKALKSINYTKVKLNLDKLNLDKLNLDELNLDELNLE
jgi:predicted HAD superfamily Cof-like phosphohydrolase